jgi:hypothetical protein
MSSSDSLQSFPSFPSFTGLPPDLAAVGAMDRTMSGAYETDVNRTMSVPPAAVEQRIADGTPWHQGTVFPLDRLGALVIDGPLLRAFCSGVPGWRASGRLVGRAWSGRPRSERAWTGRAWSGRVLGRVDLEVIPWSSTTTGLRLARRSPFPSYWSARRVRRYWALAHAAADRLAGLGLRGAADEAGQLVGRPA